VDGLAFPNSFLVSAAASYVHLVKVAIPNKGALCPQANIYAAGIYSDGGEQPRATYLPGTPNTVSVSGGGSYNNSLI
jgi:hypothetical protein